MSDQQNMPYIPLHEYGKPVRITRELRDADEKYCQRRALEWRDMFFMSVTGKQRGPVGKRNYA